MPPRVMPACVKFRLELIDVASMWKAGRHGSSLEQLASIDSRENSRSTMKVSNCKNPRSATLPSSLQ
eukprot:6201894-Pleurochrysis_carterae.AAC.1